MLIQEWLKKVQENKEALFNLVCRYHPANLKPHRPMEVMAKNITAPNAERACEDVRKQIRSECLDNPEIIFNVALQKNDVATLSELLGSTWFGVPESTDCWQINGFGVLVDLLDDPPEEEVEYAKI